MREYIANNTTYIDIKDIRAECKEYCKGTHSYAELLRKKNITNTVYGRTNDNGELIITSTYSKKFGSIFINKEDLGELFENRPVQETLPPAPPLIEDKDLVFFKDDEGKEYSVPMRGERTREGIYFQVKAVMWAFDMKSLNNDILKEKSGYQPYRLHIL